MTFRVDCYIPEGLDYLATGDNALLDAGNSDLRASDSVTGSGIIEFTQAVGAACDQLDGETLMSRLRILADSGLGLALINFIVGTPNLLSAKMTSLLSESIMSTECTRLVWFFLMRRASKGYMLATDKALHPILQHLTLGYLNDSEEYLRFSKLADSDADPSLPGFDFFRKVASQMGHCVTSSSADFHDQVLASHKGIKGLLDAGLELPKYMNKIIPPNDSKKFLQPKHFKRMIGLFAHYLHYQNDASSLSKLENLIDKGVTPEGPAITGAWQDFFSMGATTQNRSFSAWARLLVRNPLRKSLMEAYWQDPDIKSKLLLLEPQLVLELAEGISMKAELLKRYPVFREHIFTKDLGL